MNDNQLPKPSQPGQAAGSAGQNQGQGQAQPQAQGQGQNQSQNQGQNQAQPQNQNQANQAAQGSGSDLPPPSAMGSSEGQAGQAQAKQAQTQPSQQPQQPQQPQQQAQGGQAQTQPQQQPQQNQQQQAGQQTQSQQQSQLDSPMPPTSLTALSSMSSTNLPEDRQENQPQEQPQQPKREGDIRAQKAAPQSQQQGQQNQQGSQQSGDNQDQDQQDPSANDPKFAQAKKPWVKYAAIVGVGLIVLAGLGYGAMRFLSGDDGASSGSVSQDPGTQTGGRTTAPTEQTTIEYWGLWEPETVMSEVIDDFEEQNPAISVTYVKQSRQDYRERLQTAIASGNGPDVFRYHATWVPMFSDDLSPLPNSVISTSEFRQNYYPVAEEQLQHDGQLVGIPIMYDGLALLYNQEIFDSVGEEPPQTWSEVRSLANTLTVRSEGEINRAGIAMGTTNNVDHFSDILAVLILQNGADLSSPNSAFVRDALLFYTNFATQDQVWDETLPNSTVAFARGEAAMIFAPSWRIHEIEAMNPDIEIGVAPLPLLGESKIAWASYWAEGINARSENKQAAASFLNYLTQDEVLQQFYAAASETRSFGEPYPKPAMADLLADDEYVAPYLQDAPDAQSWYLSSATYDNGINDQMIKYYEDAVNAIVNGERTADEVLTTLDQGTRQVLRQYNVTGE